MANQPTCTSPTRYRTHTCWMSFSNILYFNHIFGVITWYFSKCIFPKPIQLQVRRCMVWSSILNQWSTVWCTGEDAFYLIAVAYDLDGNGLFGLLANGGRNLKIGRWTKLENHIFVPGIFVGGEYGNVCYTWIISYIYIYVFYLYIYIYIWYTFIIDTLWWFPEISLFSQYIAAQQETRFDLEKHEPVGWFGPVRLQV